MSPSRVRSVATLAVAALAAFALAGCAAGDDGSGGQADLLRSAQAAFASGDAVLYLNLTIDGVTYQYSTARASELPPLQPPGAPPPLEVRAEIGISGLPDVPAGDVTWSLDWDDAVAANGSADPASGGDANATADLPRGDTFPASATHTYAAEGTRTIEMVAEMADQQLGAIQAPIDVGGASAGVPPGTELGRAAFNETGQLPLGVGGCGSPDAQVDFPWTFDASVNATPAEVSRVVLALDTEGVAQQTGLQLLDANQTVVAEASGSGPDPVLDAVGPFPAGDYTVRVLGCTTTVDASFVVDGEATYVASAASQA